jgi:hypothetical protein
MAPVLSGNSWIREPRASAAIGPNTIGCTCCHATIASSNARRAACRRSGVGCAQKSDIAASRVAVVAAKRW